MVLVLEVLCGLVEFSLFSGNFVAGGLFFALAATLPRVVVILLCLLRTPLAIAGLGGGALGSCFVASCLTFGSTMANFGLELRSAFLAALEVSDIFVILGIIVEFFFLGI